MNAEKPKLKVALLFFGITRSLKWTIASIKQNIFEPLKENNIDYDTFMHTYKLTSNYINPRANEIMNVSDIDNDEYKLLKPDFLQIDIQEEIKKNINVHKYRTNSDPWNTKYVTVDNYILGCYSRAQLVKMVKQRKNEYDYILYIRPDCTYTSKLNIDWFNKVNDKTICIPDFHTFPINDRFSICNMKNYEIYGNIFNSLLEISKKRPLHSETILQLTLKNNNIRWINIDFKFIRTRYGGRLVERDLCLS
tara:strand:- start:363 stop:1112 length:750 start_codon:yes stop_codon:yes gene_type:complete